jgi:FixJ family two-component response regulator
VSDVDMPDISGFELIARLQTLGQTPPVVLLSARADEAMAEAASRSGARHLFPKPVPTRAFRSAVCSILDL